MTDPLEGDRKLEHLFTEALRGLPARRAPPSLESRVLDELQRQTARVWWQHGFAHWPQPARAVFIGVCVTLIGLTTWAKPWLNPGSQALHEAVVWSLSWAQPAVAVVASAASLWSLLAHAIPAPWGYAGLGLGALLYLALFALGAAAYRTLYLAPGSGLPPAVGSRRSS